MADAELVQTVKKIWPSFSISKELLQNPQQDFVVRFLTEFVRHINDGLFQATERDLILGENISHIVEPEVKVFIIVKNLMFGSENKLKFSVFDVYSPTPSRTRSFIKIFTHYLSFFDSKVEELKRMYDDVREEKEYNEGLLQRVEANAIVISDLKNSIDKLEKIKSEVRTQSSEKYKQIALYKEELARRQEQYEQLLEKCKKSEAELEHKEKLKQKLQSQIVDPKEFEALRDQYSNMEQEVYSKNIEQEEFRENIKTESESIQYLESCLEDLKYLEWNADFINEYKTLKKNLRTNKKKQSELEFSCKELDTKIGALQSEIESFKGQWNELSLSYEKLKVEFSKNKQMEEEELLKLNEDLERGKEKHLETLEKLKYCKEKLENSLIDLVEKLKFQNNLIDNMEEKVGNDAITSTKEILNTLCL